MSESHFVLYAEGGWIEVTNDGSRLVRIGTQNWAVELVNELRARPHEVFLAVPLPQMADMGLQPVVKHKTKVGPR